MTYTATTANGIPYIKALYDNTMTEKGFDYHDTVDRLDELYPTRQEVMSGSGATTQYTIGSRSKSSNSLTASEVLEKFDELMRKKKQLERSAYPRRSVGVVMRDW